MNEIRKEDRMTILHVGDEYEKYMGASVAVWKVRMC